jgi:hypothetical protein
MVTILREHFVPEFGMYREYRGTPRTEKITEDAACVLSSNEFAFWVWHIAAVAWKATQRGVFCCSSSPQRAIASPFSKDERGFAFRVRPHTGKLTPYPFRRETWPKTEGNLVRRRRDPLFSRRIPSHSEQHQIVRFPYSLPGRQMTPQNLR